MKEDILKTIEDLFLKEVKDNKSNTRPYFYKWVSTYIIANSLKLPTTKVRNALLSLEKENKVIAERSYKNNTKWSLLQFEGFKEHKYNGYLERKTTTEIIKEIQQKTNIGKDKIKRAIKFRKKEPIKNAIEDEIPEEQNVPTVVQQVNQLLYITKINGSVIIRLG